MRLIIPALLCLILVSSSVFGANEASYNSATISGLGARNIGSATMSGRISAIAGVKEPSGKITLFVGAASGGIWKSDDGGTRFRPVFDEQLGRDRRIVDPQHRLNWRRHLQIKRWRRDLDQCRIAEVGTNRPNCCESEKQRHCFCQCAGSALERLGRSRALSHNRWRQKLGARAQGE